MSPEAMWSMASAPGHVPPPDLDQVGGQCLGQPGGAVLQAAHQDIGRGPLEGEDGLPGRPQGPRHLHHLVGDGVPVLVGGPEGLPPGVVPGPGQQLRRQGVDAPAVCGIVGLEIERPVFSDCTAGVSKARSALGALFLYHLLR